MDKFFMQLFCHHDFVLNRWHRYHGPNGNDPAMIEAEYICTKCGKKKYTDDSIKNIEKYENTIPEHERRNKND